MIQAFSIAIPQDAKEAVAKAQGVNTSILECFQLYE